MSNLFSRIGLVSALTMVSRFLGLARDVLTSAVFGASIWHSAFVTAFMIPNLFRRLLGEGALTAALMPGLSEELKEGGREGVFKLVNKTLSWLLVICAGLCVLAYLVFSYVQVHSESEKWILGGTLGKTLFPYILPICLAAIISAALNLLGKFGVPALTAVWLNSSMIAFLGLGGWLLGGEEREKMILLCIGTMLGGALQLVAPAWALAREGWRPRFDLGLSERVKMVAALTLPGVFGASVHQINVVVTRGLAFDLSEAGATLIYLANRLVELPVGVFAIAISTVVFPSLSK
ncbi:MAG: murein biosynthesis integral membrane protein MurJ, partial [Symploca sp. SIO2D2]|nr:murein biosynthesis integral membrane protein MurJ [Symploca sp. SIO2D2]